MLGFFLLLTLLGLGSCAYLAYRVKKKADEVQKTYKTDQIQSVLKTVASAAGVPGMKASKGGGFSYPAWTASTTEVKIPLRPGLTIVTAINQTLGDYESFKSIQKMTAEAVEMTYSADMPDSNPFEARQPDAKPAPVRRVNCNRIIDRADLKAAHDYHESFCGSEGEHFPGTTALGVSAEVLNDLKTKGESPFSYQVAGLEGLFRMFKGLGELADPNSNKNATSADLTSSPKVNCALKRVGQNDSAIPVLVNDQRVQLPAIHATCVSGDDEGDFYFLDDPDNPISLAWQIGDSDKLQVVKITFPPEKVTHQIEQELTETGRAEVYGIYFDFASATIRAESEPTLREIAGIMQRNPNWSLSVEGHTDNIGGDRYNMDLSQKRAEAVKTALVERYKISAARLTPAGFGMTRPKEPNDTLEGRARNRRVELVKQ